MRNTKVLIGVASLALTAGVIAPITLNASGGGAVAAHSTSPAPALFGAASATAARQAPDFSRGTAKRSRYVSFRGSLLPTSARNQKLSLPFFKDAQFTATVAHMDKQQLFTSWSGPLDTTLGTFVATRAGNTYQITANTPHGSYTMTQTDNGSYQVEETNPPTNLESDSTDLTNVSAAASAAADRTGAVDRRKKQRKGGDDGSVEDILVAYTAQAAAAYGGDAGIIAEAAKNIAYTNAAYANSGVTTSVRLVGVVPVSGTEVGGDLSADLMSFSKKGDGQFDEVFKDIKASHADDAILLEKPYSAGAPFCGLGYRADGQPAKYSFAVVPTGDCTNAYPSFPHELSHNQGNGHDPYQAAIDGSTGQYPYSFGYIPRNFAWRTVMSYATECEDKANVYCDAIFYFSNPAVSYGGQPTGTAAQNNAAKTISKTRKRMAQHQQSTLYPRGKVAISPKPAVGKRVHVKFKGWINGGVHTKVQWYRDGKPIKHAKHRTYTVKAKDKGTKLAVVITGKKHYYAPVAVGSNARKVKGHGKKKHHRTVATPAAASAVSLVDLGAASGISWL